MPPKEGSQGWHRARQEEKKRKARNKAAREQRTKNPKLSDYAPAPTLAPVHRIPPRVAEVPSDAAPGSVGIVDTSPVAREIAIRNAQHALAQGLYELTSRVDELPARLEDVVARAVARVEAVLLRAHGLAPENRAPDPPLVMLSDGEELDRGARDQVDDDDDAEAPLETVDPPIR